MGIARTCSKCFKRIESGQQCPCSPAKARQYASHDNRKSEKGYSALRSKHYLRSRQIVINNQGGYCASCGVACAQPNEQGSWRITLKGAETHHIQKRRDDGADEPENLVLLCKSCHVRIEPS